MEVEERIPLKSLTSCTLNLGISLLLVACASPSQEIKTSISIDGSSTVDPISHKAIEAFKSSYNKPIEITANISGTTGGFRKFCQGQIDISNASRPIQTEEMDLCWQNGVSYIELPIAFDALTVVVNPQNAWIASITTEELKKIWQPAAQRQITRWNQVRSSFPDKPLNLFGPDRDSGTYDYFTEAIVGVADESRTDYVASEDDNITIQGVSQDPNAMGYLGLSYYEANPERIKALEIDSGKGSVFPSRETVEKAIYQPLARPLFIYVNLRAAQENSVLQEFVEFYLQNAVAIVQSANYVPLTEESYHINTVTFQKGEAGTVFGGSSQFDLTLSELQRKQAQLRVESK